MLNEIRMTVSGNVTRAPEVKHRKVDGRPFTVVPIAVNERRWDSGKEQFIEVGTTFYDIICTNGMGANALASLDVGTPVIAHGRFKLHEWATDTSKGAKPTITADSIGVDLRWGTTSYSKGTRPYPRQPDDYLESLEDGEGAERGGEPQGELDQARREGYQLSEHGEVLATPDEQGAPGYAEVDDALDHSDDEEEAELAKVS